MSDRGAMINLCGSQYELILTTKATKEINRRYGGLDKLGDKLSESKDFEEIIDELVWLLTLLINQGILAHNAVNKFFEENQKPLFSEDDIEVLTSPADFADYKGAIYEALKKGAKRRIKSEETSKNVTVG